MLSCWSELPIQRPTFSKLRTTFDTMLLADRKGDYVDFSSDMRPFRHSQVASDQDRTSMCSANSLHFPDFLQVVGGGAGMTHGGGGGGNKTPNHHGNTFFNSTNVDELFDDGNCTLESPQASTSPKHSSPDHDASKSQASGKPGPQLPLHLEQPSLKAQNSPLKLHVDQQSLDTISNCSRLSYVSSGTQVVQENGEMTSTSSGIERPRPMSLLLSRDRSNDENSNRYVTDPTKLLTLNADSGYIGGFMGGGASKKMGRASGGGETKEMGGSTGSGGRKNCRPNGRPSGFATGISRPTGTEGGEISKGEHGKTGEPERREESEDEILDPLVLIENALDSDQHVPRRHSDGMLNMNSDGYVSFLELHPPRLPDGGHDAQDYPLPDLPQIQITMTEDL